MSKEEQNRFPASDTRSRIIEKYVTGLRSGMGTLRRFQVLSMIVFAFFLGPGSIIGNAATGSPEVKVGSELEFPPYAFVDEQGRPAGFSVDLIKAVANAMGLSIRISTGPWHTVWSDLVAGRLDALPVVAKHPERTRLVGFSLPHTETYDAFFVRKGDDLIRNIEAARGKEIVVMRSDVAHHALLEHNFQKSLILVGAIPEGLALIASGKYDAFLCSKLIGTLEMKEHEIKGLTAGPPIHDYKRVFSFAVKKGDVELLEKLNQGLLIIKTNGEYDRIYEKWLTADDPFLRWEKYLLPAGVTVVAFVVIAGTWGIMLQLLVRKRTHELAEMNVKLNQARGELEERVEQRTLELTRSNKALQTEITERKRVEEDLARAKDLAEARTRELEIALKELEGFTYSVSHDLRAPIRHIIGFSDLMRKKCWTALDEQGRQYFELISSASRKLGTLMDELLEFSRMGRAPMKKSAVDLAALANEVVESFAGETAARRIEWTIGSLPTVQGDASMLRLVLANLLSNAVKFTRKKEQALIEIGHREEEKKYVIYIKDNGAGFEMQYVDKLFGVFQRLHRESDFEGTGIGLANVARIIHRHCGQVQAEGAVGSGAVFSFTLPKT